MSLSINNSNGGVHIGDNNSVTTIDNSNNLKNVLNRDDSNDDVIIPQNSYHVKNAQNKLNEVISLNEGLASYLLSHHSFNHL